MTPRQIWEALDEDERWDLLYPLINNADYARRHWCELPFEIQQIVEKDGPKFYKRVTRPGQAGPQIHSEDVWDVKLPKSKSILAAISKWCYKSFR
jgi:hypothetical protein